MTTAVMIAAAVADGLAFALLLFSSVRLIGGLEGTTVGRRAVNMLYPLSQMAFIGYNMVSLHLGGDVRYRVPYALLLAAFAVLCAMGDVALFRNLAEAERALLYRERRARLEQQLHAQRRHLRMLRRELDKAMAVDEVIETRLAEARTALACRDADAVYAWCADLSARLPRCRAFCRHKAVDALCATIIPALRRDGVACDLDIGLDDDCPLSSAELCALFANLLDNAGTACLALPRDRRWMTLRAHVVLGCLVIEASNAAASPPRRSFREDAAAHGCRFGSHGWGLSIIRGIAERHGGTFDVSHVVLSGDGPKFIARVVVPCPAQSVMT